MQEIKNTYCGKILRKHVDELFKRIEEEPRAARDIDTFSLAMELAIIQGAMECIDDLDSRLRKLEARAPKYHD